MGMDRCIICERLVDSKADQASYDNPLEACVCHPCAEEGLPIAGWLLIETAPKGRDVELAGYIVPSAEAYRNGSRSHWTFGKGRHFGAWWTGILGGKPSFWKESQTKG